MSEQAFEERDKHESAPEMPLRLFAQNQEQLLIVGREVDNHFSRLLRRLRRAYAIDRAALAFHNHQTGRMQVTHLYDRGSIKSGVTLNFSADRSVMYQVLLHGFPVADNFPERISGNIIETKILLTPAVRSVLIIPLIAGLTRLGVASLASYQEAAFGLYFEGIGTKAIAAFVDQISRRLQPATTAV